MVVTENIRFSSSFSGLMGPDPSDMRLRTWAGFNGERLAVGTSDGEHFEWPLQAIVAKPYDTTVMELDLNGTVVFFVADDPLQFASEIRKALESVPRPAVADPRPGSEEAAPFDHPMTIATPVAPRLRRSVDRDRLTPVGRRGKMRRPKRHAHLWDKADATYGLTRYVCGICRHVSIVASPTTHVTVDLRERWIVGRKLFGSV